MAADDPLTQAARVEIERRSRVRRPDSIEIALDDAPTVSLFMSLGTQWRHAGMSGVRIGLDYAAVPPTAQMLGVEMNADRLHDLRVMEGEALAVWAKR